MSDTFPKRKPPDAPGIVKAVLPAYQNNDEVSLTVDTSGRLVTVGSTFAGGAIDQGNPNTDANGWPVKITDGVDEVDIIDDGGIKRLAVQAQLEVDNIEIGTVDQGSPAVLADAWPVVQTDGTGTIIGVPGSPVEVAATSLPLPTGAATEATLLTRATEATLATRATEATLATRVADATITARLGVLGQAAMAASAPVVIASNQSTLHVDGTGVAGVPAGGVLSVQGVPGGTAIPISGTITASDASVGLTGGPAPGSTQLNGGTDGVNIQSNHMFDLDTGVGTEYDLGVSLRKAAPGGSVELGTLSDPMRVDPTGTTTQPISAVSLPLPTGAATEVTLATRATEATLATRASEATVASILAQLDVALSTRASQATVAAILAQLDVALSTRASESTLALIKAKTDNLDVLLSTRASEATLGTRATEATLATRATEATLVTRASEATLATLLLDSTFTSRINTLGQKAMAASTPVVIASDQSTIAVSATIPGTVDVSDRAARLIGHVTVDNFPADSDSSAFGAALPVNGEAIGASDGGGLLRSPRVFDLDTGAGTEYDLGVSLRLSAGGGSVEGGTLTNPIRTDPTGTTTQPVSGTVAVTQSTSPWVENVSQWGGAATTLGQKVMASSVPVVIASDQTVIPVSDNAGSLTVDTPQLPAALVGARLDTNVGAWLGSTAPTVGSKVSASSVPVVIASDQGAVTVTGGLTQVQLEVELDEKFGDLGQKTMAGSAPVVIASDQSDVGVKQATASSLNAQVVGVAANGAAVSGNPIQIAGESAGGLVQRLRTAIIPPVDSTPGVVVRPVVSQTGTTTSVAASVANVTLLAANTSRLDAVITNDGNRTLFVKLGATATSSSYTYKLLAGERTPPLAAGYEGIIDGIWSSAAAGAGSAIITEMT